MRMILRYIRGGDPDRTVRTALVPEGYLFQLPSPHVRYPENVAMSEVVGVVLVPDAPPATAGEGEAEIDGTPTTPCPGHGSHPLAPDAENAQETAQEPLCAPRTPESKQGNIRSDEGQGTALNPVPDDAGETP